MSLGRVFLMWLLVPCLGLAASFTEEGTKYYAEFYSSQGAFINTARTSHTFARFYKVVDGERTEVVDISWLPQAGFFSRGGRMPLFRAVPGRNYSLEETFGKISNRNVFNNGKYEISPELFGAARNRKAELESGRHFYKMLDRRVFPGGTNCIHAVSGVLGYLNTGLRRGNGATNTVVGMFLNTGHMWAVGREPKVEPPPLNQPRYRMSSPQTVPPPAPAPAPAPSHATPAPATYYSRRPVALPRFHRIFFGRRG